MKFDACERNFEMNIESSLGLYVLCFLSFDDWFRIIVPPYQPIRLKLEISIDLITCVNFTALHLVSLHVFNSVSYIQLLVIFTKFYMGTDVQFVMVQFHCIFLP